MSCSCLDTVAIIGCFKWGGTGARSIRGEEGRGAHGKSKVPQHKGMT